MPFPIIGGGPGDYVGAAIANACRFNNDDSAQLSRTPAGAGDSRQMTISGWLKPGNVIDSQTLLAAPRGAGLNGFYVELRDDTASQLQISDRDGSGTNLNKISNASFRDPSAWYHVVVAIDTDKSTADDRCKVWVNGTQITSWATNINYPINEDLAWLNTTAIHYIGARNDSGPYSDGYMAETIFVDGQALGPENFGETQPITGQWVPKTYIGSYGTNGFRLDYADAADLGNDASGNANDWTPSGLAANDQAPDTPTNNYCVHSSIDIHASITLANGNLEVRTNRTADDTPSRASFGVSSGKWYWEATVSESGATFTSAQIGVAPSTHRTTSTNTRPGTTQNGNSGVGYRDNGQKEVASSTTSYGASYTNGDVIGIALDVDGGTVEFFKNNASQGSISLPANDTGVWMPMLSIRMTSGTGGYDMDFGQLGFTYTPPAGFKALTARNLDGLGILRGDDYFAANTRNGTGASGSVSGLRFQPDLVWNKSRDEGSGSYTGDHKLWDAVRGATRSLESNTADQEATEGTGLSAFNSDGFDFGALDQINFSGDAFIDWCWKEGAPAGFDIVRYSGDNTANRNISHALGVAPDFALIKRLDASEDWFSWHTGLTGNNYFMKLNTTAAQTNAASPFGTGNWSATQFMVDDDATNNANASGTNNYIAYLFAGVPGFSKFGSYVGNASADGPFVWCGFRPAFVMLKRITATEAWNIRDNKRVGYNDANLGIQANAPDMELGSSDNNDFLSNGFKLRVNGRGNNSGTYIFAAFAEAPFKYARAR